MVAENRNSLIRQAQEYANHYRHDMLLAEHMLLALVDGSHEDVNFMLEEAGADIADITHDLHLTLVSRDDLKGHNPRRPPMSGALDRAVDDVCKVTKAREGYYDLTPFELLLSIIMREALQSPGIRSLRQVVWNDPVMREATINLFKGIQNVYGPEGAEKRIKDINRRNHGTHRKPVLQLESGSSEKRQGVEKDMSEQKEQPHIIATKKDGALEKYCVNLNEQAAKGRVKQAIGREDVKEKVFEVMARLDKGNPLLVGEPGVGKTAIAESLAIDIVEGRAPSDFGKSNIFKLDMTALIAGTTYRGQFESRMKELIEEIEKTPGAILFIDEIHTVIGAGSAEGTMDFSNIFKPTLQSGRVKVIGATTPGKELRRFQRDPALNRRFDVVDVPESAPEDSKTIMRQIKGRYENAHRVYFSPEVTNKAVDLAHRYLHKRKLPDSAIDLLDQVGAALKLDKTRESVSAPDPAGGESYLKIVKIEDLERQTEKMAGRKAGTISLDNKAALVNLRDEFSKRVFGQPDAIEAFARAIVRERAGLNDPVRPAGVFLLLGPTGSGKTELSRTVADLTGRKLVKLDMSEYQEKHNVARLVGAPPGYVGYDEGGQLTGAVDKDPYVVVLLDEIEKAHPDVYKMFLQVFEDGKLTDGHGKTVDFKHTILIMTSNLGEAELKKKIMGFSSPEQESRSKKGQARDENVLKKQFLPEFMNRIDEVVRFNHLDAKAVEQVAEKFVEQIRARLTARNISLTIDEPARLWLARHGRDDAQGARPMRRLVEKQIADEIADALIVRGDVNDGGSVTIGVREDGSGNESLFFEFTKASAPTAANDNDLQQPQKRASQPRPGVPKPS